MPLDWIDVSTLSFNSVLKLEPFQLGWLQGNPQLPRQSLALALKYNPAVAWYMRNACPQIASWVDEVVEHAPAFPVSAEQVRAAEVEVLGHMVDWLVYAINPAIYDALPFTVWDDREVTNLVDLHGKVVADIGAGTGRLALIAARSGAAVVYAIEPVSNLRRYLRRKATELNLVHFYVQDGFITAIPFPEAFFDVILGGHVYGDEPEAELAELERVTKPGGTVLLCPGSNDRDDAPHACLLAHGYQWGRFYEGGESEPVRKYWKQI